MKFNTHFKVFRVSRGIQWPLRFQNLFTEFQYTLAGIVCHKIIPELVYEKESIALYCLGRKTAGIAGFNGLQLAQMKKVHSLHVHAIKFIRKKQLVENIPIILQKLRFLWICEIWVFKNSWKFDILSITT